MQKQFKDYGTELSNIIIGILKKDQDLVKNNLSGMILQLANTCEDATLKELISNIKSSTFDLLWEFCYSSNPNPTPEDFVNQLMVPFSQTLLDLAYDSIASFTDKKMLNLTLINTISMIQSIEKEDYASVFKGLMTIIQETESSSYP